jgi:hypothetical protein
VPHARRYKRILAAWCKMQASFRARRARKAYLRARAAAVKLQAFGRMVAGKARYRRRRRAVSGAGPCAAAV